jgi:uncharacterized membrane protein
MLDLLLAIVHHVLVFGIFGIWFAEFMALRPDMNNATAVRVAYDWHYPRQPTTRNHA